MPFYAEHDRARKFVTAILLASLSGRAAGLPSGPGRGVTLSRSFELISAADVSPDLAYKLDGLAKIDPNQPVTSEVDTQTLSLFGREDMIARFSQDYQPNGCAPLSPSQSALDEIGRRAQQTSIVIINESHERSRDRGFTTEMIRLLRPLGYNVLALEALSHPPADEPEQYLPPIVKHPERPYFEDGDGVYVSEAAYGRLGREAKALGFQFLPYEDNTSKDRTKTVSRDQQIDLREEAQASNLASFIKNNPRAKLLIHVGYSHASEVERADGKKWMAVRLKEKTGIDPLTISQTTCRGGSASLRLSMLPPSEPPGAFDLIIDHPAEQFTRGRPNWRIEAGGCCQSNANSSLDDAPWSLRMAA
jgi:hypothetical protein